MKILSFQMIIKKYLAPVLDAKKKGVFFDVGHGNRSFDFTIAENAISNGFMSDSISTDLHIFSFRNSFTNLTDIVVKFMAFEIPIYDLIKQVTINPAHIIKRKDIGNLRPNTRADIFVFSVEEKENILVDCANNKKRYNKHIVPHLTIKNGICYEPEKLKKEVEMITNEITHKKIYCQW
ncbi:Amidohydrolase [Beggiatoa sp. PS]|nr:Amidohydrolase [Beggiatoa sp. PS]